MKVPADCGKLMYGVDAVVFPKNDIYQLGNFVPGQVLKVFFVPSLFQNSSTNSYAIHKMESLDNIFVLLKEKNIKMQHQMFLER